jgi:hypothetical protein
MRTRSGHLGIPVAIWEKIFIFFTFAKWLGANLHVELAISSELATQQGMYPSLMEGFLIKLLVKFIS